VAKASPNLGGDTDKFEVAANKWDAPRAQGDLGLRAKSLLSGMLYPER